MTKYFPRRVRPIAQFALPLAMTFGASLAHAQQAPPSYADMRTWKLEGAAGGNWVDPSNVLQPFTSATSGRNVFQTVNNQAGTMFLVSNDTNVINRAVWGTVRVISLHRDANNVCVPTGCGPETDDDYLGFVVGYQNVAGNVQFPEKYIGFTWNRGGTAPYAMPGGSTPGIYLVNASPPDAATGNPTGAGTTVVTSDVGASAGWAYDVDYQFRILYTTNLIRVYINDVLRLEATAAQVGVSSFEAGQFGFTNASQANVLFGNVREAAGSAVDSAPVASDDKFYYGLTWGAAADNTNVFDTDADARAEGILANDYDPDGDPFKLRVNGTVLSTNAANVTITGTAGGSFQVFGSGRIRYTAPADYQTRDPFQDTFTYTIVDEDGERDATVTLTVQETNTVPDGITLKDVDTNSTTDIRVRQHSAPNTVVGTIATDETNPGELDVYDYELTNASNGAFAIIGNQLVVRDTAALNGAASHSITIRSSDVEGQTTTQSFTVHVDPNTLPTAANASADAAAAIPTPFALADFASNFSDTGGDTLQRILITTVPAQGTLFLDLNDDNVADANEIIQVNFNDIATSAQLTAGRLKYLSNSATDTSTTFQFKVSDGTAYSTSAYTMTVSVHVDVDGDGIPNSVEGGGDVDNDGHPNYDDTDADGDGLSDTFEGVGDTDGDSVPNFLDTDSDGDGIPDSVEGAADSDGDTVLNFLDTDSDGDGIPDSIEGAGDVDGDSIPNYLDDDSDGDGILDSTEGGGDNDGDSIRNFLDDDSDNDGILDAVEGTGDLDGDGIPDFRDTDRDGDGVPDGTEISQGTNPSDIGEYRDTDRDGVPDFVEGTHGTNPNDPRSFRDTDSDGVPDYVETQQGTNPNLGTDFSDADNDGFPDYRDVDADNDGVPDIVEGTGDSDGDGIPDYLDRDSDNDGIPDAFEGGAYGVDSDGDGIDDRWDASAPGSIDANGDGIADDIGLLDSDGDGIPDVRDQDSDNDGVSDGAEGGASGRDSDHDGIDDAFDVDTLGGTDANRDGIPDNVTALDSDADGIPDFLDLDSDNDSIFDVIEAGGTDEDGDGFRDEGKPLITSPADTDGDGTPDLRDLESLGDGVKDITRTRFTALDADRDGRIDDVSNDADGDGIPDAIDGEPGQRGSRVDNDDDGVPASLDQDDDGDGIPDSVEGDGDLDGDGVIDRLDRDGDNDGIPDRIEMGLGRPSGIDANRNGIDDMFELAARRDSDGDGIPDYMDSDSDNDGIPDSVEMLRVALLGSDGDGDGIDDAIDVDATGGVDANGDGVDDAKVRMVDTDGDGLEYYRDPDSDNDGIPDGKENGDFNNDGINDMLQRDPGLKTGLKGGGGHFGVFGVLGLLGVMLTRRRRMRAVPAVGGAVLAAVAMAATVSSSPVQAAESGQGCRTGSEFTAGCWNVGVSIFKTHLHPDDSQSVWSVVDDNDFGFKLSAQYRFHDRWFFELGYADMGNSIVVHRNPAFADRREPVDYQVPSLFGGYLLLDPDSRFNAYVKAGYAALLTDAANDVINKQQHSDQFALGAGARLNLWQRLSAELEYEYYDKDARQVGLGVRYSF